MLFMLLVMNIYVALGISYNLDERELDQRKLFVESSFKLDLPPHLIVPSASIKLNETIGQGMLSFYSNIDHISLS